MRPPARIVATAARSCGSVAIAAYDDRTAPGAHRCGRGTRVGWITDDAAKPVPRLSPTNGGAISASPRKKRPARRDALVRRIRLLVPDPIEEWIDRERATGAPLLAGGVAYRLFFWVVPLGLVLAGLASLAASDDPAQVEDAARSFGLGAVAATQARQAFETGAYSRWFLLVSGLVLLVWFGASAARALRITCALAWGERPTPLPRPLAASLAFSGVTITAAALGVLSTWLRHQAPAGGLLVTLSIVVVAAGLALLGLRLLPHGDADWTGLVPGALLVAVGLQAMHLFVVYYLSAKLERAPELYGALGSSTVVLLWLFITARLVVSAAFLNATLWQRGTRLPPPASVLRRRPRRSGRS
jgi:uncharacterized BrkB/YihY/UPF0761 family membrane protein